MKVNLTVEEIKTTINALEFYWAQTEDNERAMEIAATMMIFEDALAKCG